MAHLRVMKLVQMTLMSHPNIEINLPNLEKSPQTHYVAIQKNIYVYQITQIIELFKQVAHN